jgi:hypothetical protein
VSGRRHRVGAEYGGPLRDGRTREVGPRHSAAKPANKANEPIAEASAGANVAEPVERRAGEIERLIER